MDCKILFVIHLEKKSFFIIILHFNFRQMFLACIFYNTPISAVLCVHVVSSIFFASPWFSGSGLYSGGLTWSIVLRCDDHTGIFTCDGCARDPYFYVPAETQSSGIKLSCSRKVFAASRD